MLFFEDDILCKLPSLHILSFGMQTSSRDQGFCVQSAEYQYESKQRKNIKSEEFVKIISTVHYIEIFQQEGSSNALRGMAYSKFGQKFVAHFACR